LLKTLNPIANEALRLATGAFKSTPVETLHVLTNELPLNIRREQMTLKYYYKLRSQISNPAFNTCIPTKLLNVFRHKHVALPFSIRAYNLIENSHLSREGIKPAFSYNLLNINTPTWTLNTININLELSEYGKAITPDYLYRVQFD
jgi:hypothetical protein